MSSNEIGPSQTIQEICDANDRSSVDVYVVPVKRSRFESRSAILYWLAPSTNPSGDPTHGLVHANGKRSETQDCRTFALEPLEPLIPSRSSFRTATVSDTSVRPFIHAGSSGLSSVVVPYELKAEFGNPFQTGLWQLPTQGHHLTAYEQSIVNAINTRASGEASNTARPPAGFSGTSAPPASVRGVVSLLIACDLDQNGTPSGTHYLLDKEKDHIQLIGYFYTDKTQTPHNYSRNLLRAALQISELPPHSLHRGWLSASQWIQTRQFPLASLDTLSRKLKDRYVWVSQEEIDAGWSKGKSTAGVKPLCDLMRSQLSKRSDWEDWPPRRA